MSLKSQIAFVRVLFLSLTLMTVVAVAAIFADSEGPYQPTGTLPTVGPGDFRNFGSTIATSGQIAAVGAPGWHANDCCGFGAAFVFKRDFLGWTQQVLITDAMGIDGDRFGSAVALDGNTLAISAPYRDRATPSSVNDAGSVTVYTGGGATWAKQQSFMPDDLLASNLFGHSLDLDGETLIAGAPTDWIRNEVIGNQAAYVYRRNGTSWMLEEKLTDPGAPPFFGWAVSIHGDVALVGAPGPTYGDITPLVPGEVYVYSRDGTEWVPAGTLIPTESSIGDLFGCAIDFDGTTAVIAACQAPNGDDQTSPGLAYVFVRSGSTWTQQARLRPAIDDEPLNVSSVALRDNRLVLGVPNAPSETSSRPGAAFVYERNGTTWNALQMLQPTATADFEAIGSAVAFTTDDLLVGTQLTDSGRVYVYNGGSGNGEHIYFPVIIGRPAQPGIPGALDQIVYQDEVAFRDDIFSIHADGTGKINLTQSPSDESGPAWSPDRRLIAFVRTLPSSESQLMVMNADGSGARVIATPELDMLVGPSWSPDGNSLVLYAYTKYVEWDIYRIGLDGSGLTNLTADLTGTTQRPDWSPDGSRIAFIHKTPSQVFDIWLMNADGSGKTNLTNDEAPQYSVRWSPDGATLLFDGAGEDSINAMPATGGASTLVLENAHGGSWSPDGTQIVFTGAAGGIFRANIDGQSLTPVDPSPNASGADW